MPTPGLSLVGFMDQLQAIRYMQANCVMPNPADIAALISEWTAASANLGQPFADAGHPDIQPIPSTAAAQTYIQQLQQQPWVQESLKAYPTGTLQVVEIDPLLAFQFHISLNHSDGRCAALGLGPGIVELLPICLPQMPPQASIRPSGQGQSLLIASDSLNVRIVAQGLFNPPVPPGQPPLPPNMAGVLFGVALPFVHVVRFNGRCYLINGFHRALGARKRGAGRIPCFFREVTTADETGIRTDGSTFPLKLLESSNPPTLAHFTQGRAHALPLREVMRVLQINWSEHALPME
jgi:hypothetical protein